jgi:tetratricopeptide (TPR) repeat protein
MNDFTLAASIDARNAEARRLAEEARKKLQTARAVEDYESGLKAELAGKTSLALASFRRALEADPQGTRYAIGAARAARALGDAEAACELAGQAVRASPRGADAHVEQGEALLAAGRIRDAKKAVERALELDPGHEAGRALSRRLRWKF